jgi:hypothetical protein
LADSKAGHRIERTQTDRIKQVPQRHRLGVDVIERAAR